jgi:type I restriction enzyme M protein
MLAMTNMMLHGIDIPSNIRHDNTLSRPLKDYSTVERVDQIITNPPFGGMEEDGIEDNFPKKYQTRETADLFMALIMHLLKKDGGRCSGLQKSSPRLAKSSIFGSDYLQKLGASG